MSSSLHFWASNRVKCRFLGGLLGALVAHTAYAQTAAQAQQAQVAFGEFARSTRQDAGQLWGVSLYGPVLLVVPASRVVLANMPDSTGALHEANGLFTGQLPADVNLANTAVRWAGRRWSMVLWPLPADPFERRNLLAHEAFHRVQPQLKLAVPEANNEHLAEVPGRLYLRLELAALQRAVRAGSPRAAAPHLQAALAFRAYRRRLYPRAAPNENLLELNEGLAEYTGQVLSGRAPQAAAALLVRSAQEFGHNPSFVRSFAYQTVPFYGLLLRRQAPPWTRKVTRETDLTAFFATALGVRLPANLAAWTKQAQARYGGAALAAEEQARARRLAQQLATYRRLFLDSPHLVIPLHQMNMAFDPRAAQPLGPAGTVYPTLRVTDSWGILAAAEGALMGAQWNEVRVAYPTVVRADSVAGPGYTLHLKQGWQVVKAEGDANYTVKPK